MNTKIKNLLTIIGFTIIPSFLSYAASSTYFWDKLIERNILPANADVVFLKDVCLWSGIVLSAIFLSGNLYITKNKCAHMIEQRDSLLKMNKEYLTTYLEKSISSNFSNCNVRIFVPQYPLLHKLAKRFNIKIKKTFIIKNFSIISNEGSTRNLKFEVYPNAQGLVGECYVKDAIVYDDNLKSTNSTKYELNSFQISKTSSLQWSICCPIHNSESEVVAIIALDGDKKIKIRPEKEQELSEQLFVFSNMLYETVPQLFGR